MKELVLVYREDADLNNLNTAVLQLQSMAATKDLKQTLLDYANVYDLGEGHGIFNLIELPEKAREMEEYPIEELPPQEIDPGNTLKPGNYDIGEDRPAE
jgi:hypothetical protein